MLLPSNHIPFVNTAQSGRYYRCRLRRSQNRKSFIFIVRIGCFTLTYVVTMTHGVHLSLHKIQQQVVSIHLVDLLCLPTVTILTLIYACGNDYSQRFGSFSSEVRHSPHKGGFVVEDLTFSESHRILSEVAALAKYSFLAEAKIRFLSLNNTEVPTDCCLSVPFPVSIAYFLLSRSGILVRSGLRRATLPGLACFRELVHMSRAPWSCLACLR